VRFYRDLLPLENGLVYGSKIGRVDRFAYSFAVSDPRPIRHKAFNFPRRERKWVHEYTRTQCELGVLRRLTPGVDPDPTFIQGLVLVKGGQSQQDYRACLNLVEANTRIRPTHHPMPDC